MRSIGLIVITSIIIFGCANEPQNQIEEPKVEVEEIPEFNISFPETSFEVKKSVVKSSVSKADVTNWILKGKDKNGPFMYFIAHNKIPDYLDSLIRIDPFNLEIAFKAMLTASAEKLGGYDFIFTEKKYGKYDGMESECKVFEGKGIIKSYVYFIKDDVFMISAGGENISRDSVDMFLNSFAIKK